MPDLDLVAFATRTALGKPNLDINDGVKYVLGRQLRQGNTTWRHISVTSPFVHGQTTVNSVKDVAQMNMVVYVKGTNMGNLDANLADLLEAFTEQPEYDLQFTVDGNTFRWKCERADYEVGFITEHLSARLVPVAMAFMRHPIPVAGAI